MMRITDWRVKGLKGDQYKGHHIISHFIFCSILNAFPINTQLFVFVWRSLYFSLAEIQGDLLPTVL